MSAPRKLKKRPCSVCRHWFLPDPRVAHCQKTCSASCSKALAAKRDAEWRRKNPDYEEHLRLAAALARADRAAIEIKPVTAPLARLPWRLVQVALGDKSAVALAFALRLQARQPQVAFEVKMRVPPDIPVRLPPLLEQVPIEVGS
jgi:hypothetical protein